MEDNGIEIAEQIPASRKLGESEARKLITAADEIRIAKGKKLDRFSSSDTADEIVPKMLGSTGNLRAPAIVVGGIDSLAGAVVGSLIVGLAEAYTATYQAGNFDFLGSNFSQVVPWLVMFVVLLVRPYGIFGTKEVERV